MSGNGHDSRARSGSSKEDLKNSEHDPTQHVVGSLPPKTHVAHESESTSTPVPTDELPFKGFWDDIVTMKWMQRPSTSSKIIGLPVVLAIKWAIVVPERENFWLKIFTLTNRLPDSPEGFPLYAKSYWDIAFVLYYIVFFSWCRECLAIYVLKPLARHYGVRRPAKVDRFAEQGYAVIYFTAAGSLGLWTMYKYLPTWYFRTEYAWINYPHWEMPGTLKPYYLLQTAHWLQQSLLLGLGVEKPRRDFYQFVAHHIITLWMVIWSYIMNMTLTGNIIFLTMDWSEIFFALCKCFNYLQWERTTAIAFAWFACVWTYSRHYLNFKILYSHWYEFDLISDDMKGWYPEQGLWMVWWMKHQMFFALLGLQCLNIFWYFLLWRVLLRAVLGSKKLDDERSDDEEEQVEAAPKGKCE